MNTAPEKRERILWRLLAWLVALAVVPLVMVTALGTRAASEAQRQQSESHLAGIADNKLALIEQYFWERRGDASVIASLDAIAGAARGETSARTLLQRYVETYGYSNIYVVGADGKVITAAASSPRVGESVRGTTDEFGRVVDAATTLLQVELSAFERAQNSARLYIAAPILGGNRVQGAVVLEVTNAGLQRLVRDVSGLANTGESLLVVRLGNSPQLAAPSRQGELAAFAEDISRYVDIAARAAAAASGSGGAGTLRDQRDVTSIAAWRCVPSLDGALIVKQDETEALSSVSSMRRYLLLAAALSALLAIAVATVIARNLSQPLERLTATAQAVAGGNLKLRADMRRTDEIGQVAAAFNYMTDALADSIGHLEERVAIRTAELEEARKAALAAAVAKGDFLANMSHEIRTPLNAVIGLSQLALNTQLTPKQTDYLRKIHASGNNLLGLLNDVLDFSKIEAGKVSLEAIPFSLSTVLDNTVSVVGLRAHEKKLELLIREGANVPPHLIGDPLRLGQILINLGGNAVKFTETGHVSIAIEVTTRKGDDVSLRFSVTDTGIGLTEAQQAKLFQPFTQADSSTTRRFGGTGLGLSICKHLVEAMGGTIGVDSVAGQGSTFWFTVPLKATEATRSPLVTQRINNVFVGKRALVVDDNDAAREILREQLARMGFDAHVQSSALAARAELNRANSQGAPYDLVLMDYRMPEMNGIEATRSIKDDAAFATLPVIVMVSAFGTEEVEFEATRNGAHAFLTKPVAQGILAATLANTFGVEIERANDPPRDSVNPQARLAGVNVLFAEDNPINQQVTMELLANVGAKVTVVENGQLALNAIQASPGKYAAVLMDVQMPVMDGIEATERIRQLAAGKDVPIIAMTAHAMVEEIARCKAAGMNEHLTKPVLPAILYETLVKWISPPSAQSFLQHPPIVATPSTPAGDDDAVIDHHLGLTYFNHNAELYDRLLRDFAERHGNFAASLRAAVDQGDLDAGRKLAHAVAGAAGTLALRPLMQSARYLEIKLASGNADTDAVNEFDHQMERALAAIAELPAPDVGEFVVLPEAPREDTAALVTLWPRLDKELAEHSLTALTTFSVLRTHLARIADPAAVQQAQSAIAALDFANARRQLAALLGEPFDAESVSASAIDARNAMWPALRSQLQANDMAAAATFAQLRPILQDTLGESELDDIEASIRQLEFRWALTHLQNKLDVTAEPDR